MDSFEDVSARVLLKNVLHTEQECSPVTRSTSQQQGMSSGLRRSGRLRKSDAGLLSPQVALRQKLRQDLRKSIFTGSPHQQTKGSLSMSGVMGKVKTPVVAASQSLSEDITPRHLLRGILQTEPELSLLVPDRPDSEDPKLCSTESSLCSSPSMGVSYMSNLELPDLPTANLTMAVRGISRKRPKKNMNVSVFERKIVDQSGDGSGDGAQDTTGNLSMSGASASKLSLSLNMPVDQHLDRRVLQRNPGKRKGIRVEDFEAGVQDHLAKKGNSERKQSLSTTAGMEFTLGLSNVTASPIIISNPISIPMHDWDTIMYSSSQQGGGGGGGLGERILDEAEKEEEIQVEQQVENKEDKAEVLEGPGREGPDEKIQDEREMEHFDGGDVEAYSEGGKNIPGMAAGSRAYKSLSSDLHPLGTGSQSEEEEKDSTSEREEKGASRSTWTQEGGATDHEAQKEELASGQELRPVSELISRRAYRSEGGKNIPGMAAGSRAYKSLSSGLHPLGKGSQSEEEEKDSTSEREEKGASRSTWTQEGGATDHEAQKEDLASGQELRPVSELISRRAYRSEGGKNIPGMAAESRAYKSLSSGLHPLGTGSQSEEEEKDSTSEREEKGASRSTWTQEGGARDHEAQKEELASGQELRPVSELISRRAYRSEGGKNIPGMAAGNRAYKSLSSGLHPLGKGSQSEEEEKDGTSEREEKGASRSTWTQEGGARDHEAQKEELASGQELRPVSELISRRAYRSEGGKNIPGMAAESRAYKSLSSGLHPLGTEVESDDGQVEPVISSEGGASSVWQSGPQEGSQAEGDLPQSSVALSPASSPNEIPPSPGDLHYSGGRSLLEEEEEEEEKGEENMGGANYADEAVDKGNSIPLAQPGSPEIEFTPQTAHASTRVEAGASMRTAEELGTSEDDEEDDLSQELPLETPAFVRLRKGALTPGPATTPNFLKQMMDARKPTQATAPKAKPKRKGRAAPSQKEPGLSKRFVMTTFKHFAKTTVSPAVYPVLKDILAKYFDRLADDLEAYATHAKRGTIEIEDVVLLMRRQGFVTDGMPVNVLIERYLPNEYRKLLIPVATSGNKVIPKQKR